MTTVAETELYLLHVGVEVTLDAEYSGIIINIDYSESQVDPSIEMRFDECGGYADEGFCHVDIKSNLDYVSVISTSTL